MAENTRTERLRLTIDGEQIKDSYKDLQVANRKLLKELQGVERGTDEYIKKSQQLNQVRKRIEDVKGEIKGIGSEWKKQQRVWDNAKSMFAGAFAAMSVAGAVNQIQVLGRQVVDFIKDLTKQRIAITRLTGAIGDQLDVTTAKIMTIVEVYDQSFDDVLASANAFSQQMGVDMATALDLINEGFNQGADSSGEFMSILKEYPTQFRAAGLSADQAISLITQQVQQGIFSDKGVDTIKEGTLRLREMTKATREALEGIGISSAQLEQDLRSGTITYFDAIQMVSDKLAELPPQSVEVGTALADIFGGAGEDAGLEYITMLGGVDTELQKVETQTSKLAEANERLNLAYQKLADDNGLLTKLETGFKNFTAFLLENSDTIIAGISAPISAILQLTSSASGVPVGASGPTLPPGIPALDIPDLPKDQVEPLTNIIKNEAAKITGANSKKPDEIEGGITKEQVDAQLDLTESFESTKSAIIERETNRRLALYAQEMTEQEMMTAMSFQHGASYAQYGMSIEETGKALISSYRDQAKAEMNIALTRVITDALTNVPFPANLLLATTAGFAVNALFDRLIPSFYYGGPTGSSGIGMGDQYGAFTGFTHADEYVIPKNLRSDPYVANLENYVESQRRFGTAAPPVNVNPNVTANLDSKQVGQIVAHEVRSVLQNMTVSAEFSRETFKEATDDLDKFNTTKGKGKL